MSEAMNESRASGEQINAILVTCIAACGQSGETQLCALSGALLVAARSCDVPLDVLIARLRELAPQVAALPLGPLPLTSGRGIN